MIENLIDDIKYAYLIEMKYIKRPESEKELKAEIATKLKESQEQLARYVAVKNSYLIENLVLH